jgi:HAE1 family hydrophobic/amphiphilic exporter-1
VSIQRQPGSNTVQVVDSIRALLPGLQKQLPAGVTLGVRSDRSESIRESVADVKFTLMLTVGLVVLVIFLFLRNLSAYGHSRAWRCRCRWSGTFAVMYLYGYSLDNLSLMALTLGRWVSSSTTPSSCWRTSSGTWRWGSRRWRRPSTGRRKWPSRFSR